MSEKSEQFPLKLISSIVSVITFTADLITVALFIRSVFYGDISLTASVSQVLVIIVVFAFAVLLWFYSKNDSPTPDIFFSIFGWLYIVFSAGIFIIVSQRFMMEGHYTLGEFVGYVTLTSFIGALGYFIFIYSDKRVDYFSIPFMVVALIQIIMWIYIIFSNNKLVLNWITAGNIFLFMFAGLIVLFFINRKIGSIPLSMLLASILATGYIILGFTISSLWYFLSLWIISPLILAGIVFSVFKNKETEREKLRNKELEREKLEHQRLEHIAVKEIETSEIGTLIDSINGEIKLNYRKMKDWHFEHYEQIANLAINELSVPELREFFKGLANGVVVVPAKTKYEFRFKSFRKAQKTIMTVHMDSMEFWNKDFGKRYLQETQQAIARNVNVYRIFVLDDNDIKTHLPTILEQEQAGVKILLLNPKQLEQEQAKVTVPLVKPKRFFQEQPEVTVSLVNPIQIPNIQEIMLIDDHIALLIEKSSENHKHEKIIVNPNEVNGIRQEYGRWWKLGRKTSDYKE
jgi:hypothetical protein